MSPNNLLGVDSIYETIFMKLDLAKASWCVAWGRYNNTLYST